MNHSSQDKQASFLPFHAINEFMRPDYRVEVVRAALQALPGLPEPQRAQIDKLTRRTVKVPGFRNSAKAPAALRVKPTAEAFEKSSGLVAAILSAWTTAHPQLRSEVNDLLLDRSWEILPIEADRTKIPGFLTSWPKGEDFETLTNVFAERYPQSEASSDDVSLMVVWLSGRLPYEIAGDEPDEPDQDES